MNLHFDSFIIELTAAIRKRQPIYQRVKQTHKK